MTTVVHGVPQAIAALERRKVQAKLAEPIAAKAGGEVVAAVERVRAPRRTGRLASSVVVEMEGDTAHVGSTVDYDRFVQRGTRYMAAQPYGEEAAEATHVLVTKAMEALFKLALK